MSELSSEELLAYERVQEIKDQMEEQAAAAAFVPAHVPAVVPAPRVVSNDPISLEPNPTPVPGHYNTPLSFGAGTIPRELNTNTILIEADAKFMIWARDQLGYPNMGSAFEALRRADKIDLGDLYVAYRSSLPAPRTLCYRAD
jgi:hypothetical protein